MTSVGDREVQVDAKASGLVIPTSKLDLEKRNDEWRHDLEWWSRNSQARCGCHLRELEFAEIDIEIQTNATECGISEHGTWSKDSLLTFGSWCYGSGRDTIPGFQGEERCQRVCEASVNTAAVASALGDSATEIK